MKKYILLLLFILASLINLYISFLSVDFYLLFLIGASIFSILAFVVSLYKKNLLLLLLVVLLALPINIIAISSIIDTYKFNKNANLIMAIQSKSRRLVLDKIKEGYDVNGIDNKTGYSASTYVFQIPWPKYNLLKSSDKKDIMIEILVILINNGANVNMLDGKGEAPLHYAVKPRALQENQRVEIIEFLISKGADVNIKSIKEGNTPLHISVEWSIETTKCLLEHGAELNIKNNKGNTPLDIVNSFEEVDNEFVIEMKKLLQQYNNLVTEKE